MCANWIVSVGKVGPPTAAVNKRMRAASGAMHVASDAACTEPQWRFVAGSDAARQVLQDVLSTLIDHQHASTAQ